MSFLSGDDLKALHGLCNRPGQSTELDIGLTAPESDMFSHSHNKPVAEMWKGLEKRGYVAFEIRYRWPREQVKISLTEAGSFVLRFIEEEKRLRGMLEANDINPDGEYIAKGGLRVDAPASKQDPGF